MQICQARPEAVKPAKQSIGSKKILAVHRFLRYRDHWIRGFTNHMKKARGAALDRVLEGGRRWNKRGG
jgi:hypothetical protein